MLYKYWVFITLPELLFSLLELNRVNLDNFQWQYSFIGLINTSSMYHVGTLMKHGIICIAIYTDVINFVWLLYVDRNPNKEQFYWYIDHHARLLFSVNCSVQCDFRTMVETVWMIEFLLFIDPVKKHFNFKVCRKFWMSRKLLRKIEIK